MSVCSVLVRLSRLLYLSCSSECALEIAAATLGLGHKVSEALTVSSQRHHTSITNCYCNCNWLPSSSPSSSNDGNRLRHTLTLTNTLRSLGGPHKRRRRHQCTRNAASSLLSDWLRPGSLSDLRVRVSVCPPQSDCLYGFASWPPPPLPLDLAALCLLAGFASVMLFSL